MDSRFIGLRCLKCGATHPEGAQPYRCRRCGGLLRATYEYSNFTSQSFNRSGGSCIESLGVWRYFELLPVRRREAIRTLYEGGTPLVRAERLGHALGLKSLFIKDETRNPTGTFKDRGSAVALSKALELGARRVAIASSGNAAASLAAYAARFGVECLVAVPANTPLGKLTQILAYGGRVTRIPGGYQESYRYVEQVALNQGYYNLTTVVAANPYPIEGFKTIGFEVAEQLGFQAPDWLAAPVAVGDLLVGAWWGIRELLAVGLLSRVETRLLGVQAEGCAPIVAAFERGEQQIRPWGAPRTIAHSIADPLTGHTADGELTLRAVRESRGVMRAVSDTQILEMVLKLARLEGIYAEPASVVGLVGLEQLVAEGTLDPSDTVVAIVTGSGLKSTETIRNYLKTRGP